MRIGLDFGFDRFDTLVSIRLDENKWKRQNTVTVWRISGIS